MQGVSESCTNCRFFDPYYDLDDAEEGFGSCRRHSPAGYGLETKLGIFPLMHPDDWCGDYERERACDLCHGKMPVQNHVVGAVVCDECIAMPNEQREHLFAEKAKRTDPA